MHITILTGPYSDISELIAQTGPMTIFAKVVLVPPYIYKLETCFNNKPPHCLLVIMFIVKISTEKVKLNVFGIGLSSTKASFKTVPITRNFAFQLPFLIVYYTTRNTDDKSKSLGK